MGCSRPTESPRRLRSCADEITTQAGASRASIASLALASCGVLAKRTGAFECDIFQALCLRTLKSIKISGRLMACLPRHGACSTARARNSSCSRTVARSEAAHEVAEGPDADDERS